MKKLDTKVNIVLVLLIIPWIVVSCATFEVKEPVGTAQGKFQTIITPNQQVRTDFLTEEEVKKDFGVDLYQAGIQTLNVEIQSRENKPLNTTLDDITLTTQAGASIKPLSIDEATDRIYNFTKYHAAFKEALIKAGMYGLGGAAVGAALGAIIGGAAGGATAAKGAAIGAAVGAAAGTAAGAATGAIEAQKKTPEEIKKSLMDLMLTPGKLEDTSKKGLVFFEITPEQKDISRLVVKLTDIRTRQKLDLELELERGVSLPQEKHYVPPTPLPAEATKEPTSADTVTTPPANRSAPLPEEASKKPSSVVYIKGAEVNIRADAGTRYDIVAKLDQGDAVKIIEEKGEWYHVRLPDGKEGWIAKKLTSEEKVEKAAPTKTREEARITAVQPEEKKLPAREWITINIPLDPLGGRKEADVREGPGTTYKSVAKVGDGIKLEKIERKGNWYKIKLSDGTVGWIEGVYVQKAKESKPEAPSSEPTPAPM